MKPEAQRIAIAEACGWKDVRVSCCGKTYYGEHPDSEIGRTEIPRYMSDLNAMHEAEKMLTNEQHEEFRRNLRSLTCQQGIGNPMERDYVTSAAAQRAEAFLRTLNLWKD